MSKEGTKDIVQLINFVNVRAREICFQRERKLVIFEKEGLSMPMNAE